MQTTVKTLNHQKVTVDELATILSNIELQKGMACFAQIEQLTKPKCTKKDRETKIAFDGEVHKLSRIAVILNADYEKLVINQLTKEHQNKDEYYKGKNTMPIVKCENNNFFGYYDGKPIIEYKPNQGQKPETGYYLNGKLTDKKDLPDVLPVVSAATNQGTEKEIFWRKLYLTNLVSITINKVTYEVIKM